MKCPNCGAECATNVCEYCGTVLAVPAPQTVIVNNYYGEAPGQSQGDGDGASAQPFYYQEAPRPAISTKSRLLVLLLAFFLGFLGVHRFYCGRIGLGILYIFTFGLFGFGWFIDIILAALGRMRDGYGLPIERW